MTRLRCCGRFAFWAVPLGPWCCTTCDRKWWGVPMPRSAEARFDEAIDELRASLRPWTPAEEELARMILRAHLVVLAAENR